VVSSSICFLIVESSLGELGYSGMVVSLFTTRGKEDMTYPWRCVAQMFRNVLGYLSLLAHSCVHHILYCVFVCFSTFMLQVSLDCPFFIAPSVFANVYLEVMH
jgi:hypothetical protein